MNAQTPTQLRPASTPNRRRPQHGPGDTASISSVDPIRVIRQYVWIILASAVIGAVIGVVANFLIPPVYTAEALYQVNPPNVDPNAISDPSLPNPDYYELQLATLAASMVRPPILRDAATAPPVKNTEWIAEFTDPATGDLNIDEAIDDLAERVRAIPYGETFLIRLTATGSNPGDLKRILDAVVYAYDEQIQADKVSEKNALGASFDERRDKLRNERRRVEEAIDNIRRSDDFSVDPLNTSAAIELATLNEQIILDRQAYSQSQGALRSLQTRRQQEPIEFTEEERRAAEQNREVMFLNTRVTELQTQLRRFQSQYGSNHKYVRDLQRQVNAAIDERESTLARVLRENLDIEEERLVGGVESLQKKIGETESAIAARQQEVDRLIARRESLVAKERELESLNVAIQETERRLSDLDLSLKQTRTDPVKRIQDPVTPRNPDFPRLTMTVPLGVVLIGGLTTGLIFLRELTDKRVKGPADIAVLPNGHVLGVVPHASEDPSNPKDISLVTLDAPRSVLAESVRQLRTPILQALDQAGHKSLLVLGGQPGAGSTWLTSNLAVCIANSERRVLVLEANFRRPRIASIFGVDSEPGLGDVLGDHAVLEQSVQATSVSNLDVLVAGSGEHRVVERLSTEKFRTVIARLRAMYDVILIDSPPAVVAGESMLLAQHADATALVVRALQEERGLVTRLTGQLENSRAEHLGVVLNAARSAAGGYFKRNIRHMESYRHSAGR
ncbi:MAG: GumC family protein [Phycisphaerales bacterium]